jgi:hypothetical protein
MQYTTADLLTNVKSKAAAPDSQTVFTDAILLKIADEKIRSTLVPAVLSTREDYYLTYIDYATPSTSYAIPSKAIGMKISRIVLCDSTNTEWPCVRVANPTEASEAPDYYYIHRNTIMFVTAPTKTVRVYYHCRPNVLVKTTEAARITGITGKVVSVSAVPSTITAASVVDIISEFHGYDTVSVDNAVDTIVSTDITLTDTPVADIGDWMAVAGYTPVPQIPSEMQAALEWFVVSSMMNSQTDAQGYQLAMAEASQALKQAIVILQPRVDGASKKIVRRDSTLRETADGLINQGVWIR